MNKLQKLMAGGILFLLPFFCNPWGGGDMRLQFEVPKLIGAFLLGNLCLAFFLSKHIHKAFGVVHAAFALSVVLTGFGAMQLYPFCYWLSAVGLSCFAAKDHETSLFLWKCVAISGIIAAFHAYLQMMGFSWPLQYAEGISHATPIALMGQQTKLGAFLACASVLCLALQWHPAFFFVGFVAIATKSSFTAFALVVGAAVVLSNQARRYPRIGLYISILGVALSFVGPHLSNNSAMNDHGRHLAYRDTYNAWLKKPLLGYGPGSFQELFAPPRSLRMEQPTEETWKHSLQSKETYHTASGWFEQGHLDYLQVFFEFGLLGGLAMIFALICILMAYSKTWQSWYRHVDIPWWHRFPNTMLDSSMISAKGVLACMLVNAFGNFPWLLSPMFMLGTMAAAILLRASRG